MSGPAEIDLESAAARLGEDLLAGEWTLVTAESSTAGLIGHAITMVPGASRYYLGGVIAYSNLAKELELGVDHETLVAHGAVSEPVAAAMAEGVRARFDADLGVAVTGIAGPDGGGADKPVGLHFVGASRRGHPATVERHVFQHDRDGNKAAAALAALELARREIRAG
ncbi:MAG TPA: CinA family protein [Candidatus Limnocylindria bacterium]|jgi:PncC family amidohydrolase|nr:CinA family protein [Candidatus Limnocylindria bacterium]